MWPFSRLLTLDALDLYLAPVRDLRFELRDPSERIARFDELTLRLLAVCEADVRLREFRLQLDDLQEERLGGLVLSLQEERERALKSERR